MPGIGSPPKSLPSTPPELLLLHHHLPHIELLLMEHELLLLLYLLHAPFALLVLALEHRLDRHHAALELVYLRAHTPTPCPPLSLTSRSPVDGRGGKERGGVGGRGCRTSSSAARDLPRVPLVVDERVVLHDLSAAS